MMKIYLLAAALAIFSAGASNAATVTFTSNGSFSNLSNCSGCTITNNSNLLSMSGSPASTMFANDIIPAQSFSTNADDQVLGSITWVNRASFFTDPSFNVRYTLALNFTAPSAYSDTQVFNLNITQPTNPPGDNALFLGNSPLAGLLGPFVLAGVTISDLHFRVVGGGSSFANGVWSNPEGNTSTLQIVADFASPVPEPTTWAMMFLGFAGVGAMAYRRSRKNNSRAMASV